MWRYLYTVQCTDPDLGHTAKIQYRKIRNKYSQKRNCAGLSPNFHIHVSVSDLYIPTVPPSVCLFCYRNMCGLILGINKSLTDT
jgi:hypothetical protein